MLGRNSGVSSALFVIVGVRDIEAGLAAWRVGNGAGDCSPGSDVWPRVFSLKSKSGGSAVLGPVAPANSPLASCV